jgi:hypothetical protein
MTQVVGRYAELDLSETYRYKLSRTLLMGNRSALWIGVNPSTADAEVDDASIRKLYGFSPRLNINHWWVGNLFAYRATDVKKLGKIADPVGRGADEYLRQMMIRSDLVIAGWGCISKVPPRLRYRWKEIVVMAEELNKQLLCWGTCSDGHPRHPLMLPYTSVLRTWEPPE